MGEQKGNRSHSAEFRVQVAERMMAGENVSAVAAEFELPRSMIYRWRDVHRDSLTCPLRHFAEGDGALRHVRTEARFPRHPTAMASPNSSYAD